MLTSFRKFSSSIYAKILLGIIIIPFVFWGMGSSFVGGNKNVVVVIDNEKHTTQDFANFIKRFSDPTRKLTSNEIEEALSIFIGEKLIEKEVEYFKIKLSDNSLSKLVKNQDNFKRDNKFSRVEYEKFLLKSNIPVAFFESNLSNQEKKRQLLDFISGGLHPSKFLVNISYDKINQKRNIHLINLDDLFDKKFKSSEEEIKSFYEKNKNDYVQVYKSIKIIELTPKKLTGADDYNDIYFKNLDEIDDIIISGQNLDYLIKKFNLEKANTLKLNKFGEDINSKKIQNISKDLIKKIFETDDSEPITLLESEDKYFITEVIETEDIIKKFNDPSIQKRLRSDIKSKRKTKFISKMVSEVNYNNFIKSDFDKLSKNENIIIQKINLTNLNDDKILEKELVNRIYKIPEKKIVVLHNIDLTKNLLVYIDKIQNVSVNEKSDEYKKYLNISRIQLANGLLNTYDRHIKEKYEIDINYKALEIVKNYFN